MEMSHKFTSWETFNVAAAMEEHGHLHHHHQLDHDHYQPSPDSWPYHLPLPAAAAEQSLKCDCDGDDDPEEELGAMKEMMFKIAAMQPVDIDPATIRKPRRRNVRISDDPQSVAARHRRERISEKIRILQRLVPGGTKMDTASMLDEAIRYVKFLKRQIRILGGGNPSAAAATSASYLFGGNNEDAAAGDDRACFSNYI